MKDTQINLAVEKDTKALVESMAKKAGSSLSAFLIKSAIFYGQLDLEFLAVINESASLMGVRSTSLLQVLVANQIAQADAFQDVFGRSSKSLERVFQWEKGRLLLGNKLFDILSADYKAIFNSWKEHLVDLHEDGKEFQVTDEAVEFLGGSIESAAPEMRV